MIVRFLFLILLAVALMGNASNPSHAEMPSISVPATIDLNLDLSTAQVELQNMLNSTRHDDRCGSNYNVWDAKVLPNGRSIRIDLEARYFQNKCVITGVPEWHGPFNVKMKDRIVGETTLFSQSGHIAFDVWPVIENGTVSVDVQVVTADMSGLLGKLKLNGQVKNFIESKLRPALRDKLTAALPPEVVRAGIQFSEIAFVDLGGGKLGLKIKASGTLKSPS